MRGWRNASVSSLHFLLSHSITVTCNVLYNIINTDSKVTMPEIKRLQSVNTWTEDGVGVIQINNPKQRNTNEQTVSGTS